MLKKSFFVFAFLLIVHLKNHLQQLLLLFLRKMTVNFHELCFTRQIKGYPQLKLPLMTYLE